MAQKASFKKRCESVLTGLECICTWAEFDKERGTNCLGLYVDSVLQAVRAAIAWIKFREEAHMIECDRLKDTRYDPIWVETNSDCPSLDSVQCWAFYIHSDKNKVKLRLQDGDIYEFATDEYKKTWVCYDAEPDAVRWDEL